MQNSLFDDLKDLKKNMAEDEKKENEKKINNIKMKKENELKDEFLSFIKDSDIKKINS